MSKDKQIEAMRSGLTAIKSLLSRDPCIHANTAIQMIDAMLAEQPRAEGTLAQQDSPWCMKMNGCKTKCEDCPDEVPKQAAQQAAVVEVTRLQKREWVSLTEAEVKDLWDARTEPPFAEFFGDFKQSYKVIEAKLKEKNDITYTKGGEA